MTQLTQGIYTACIQMVPSDWPVNMLDYLNPNIVCEHKETLNYPMNTESKNNHEILVYSTLMCPYCYAAKQLLKSKNLDYQEIRVDRWAH